MAEKINVLITGATGSAGSGVLQACLRHDAVEKVSIITRRNSGFEHEKLAEIVHDDFLDFLKIGDKLGDFDACFWCLGVSQAKVKKEADYNRITYRYTMEAGKILEKFSPGLTFCFLSGMGTNPDGRMMWARIKGKTESDLSGFAFKLYNFRPGFIHPLKGHKSRSILGEIFYPFFKRSRNMLVEAEELGLAMIHAALHGYEKTILENADIRKLAAVGTVVIE